MITTDIGDFTTDLDGERDPKEFVSTTRNSILGLWNLQAGLLIEVTGTNRLTAKFPVADGRTGLADGMQAFLPAQNTNTAGAVTINVSGFGEKGIVAQNGSSLGVGALVAGGLYPIVFSISENVWKLTGSSGTTNVTVQGGIQLQRSEVTRLLTEVGPVSTETAIISRQIAATQSSSRVIVEGALSGLFSTGVLDTDGVAVSLYVDETLAEQYNAPAIPDAPCAASLYFSHLPGDTDAHTYEIRVTSSVDVTFYPGATHLVLSESSPN